MLLFGLIVAVVLVIYTRKTEIISHDPSEGLPGSGGGLKNVMSTMREMAKQLEEQAKAAQDGSTGNSTFGRQDEDAADEDVDDEASSPQLEEIRDLAQRGQLIDAIKLYRMLYRVDLKSAKEAVERLVAGG